MQHPVKIHREVCVKIYPQRNRDVIFFTLNFIFFCFFDKIIIEFVILMKNI